MCLSLVFCSIPILCVCTGSVSISVSLTHIIRTYICASAPATRADTLAERAVPNCRLLIMFILSFLHPNRSCCVLTTKSYLRQVDGPYASSWCVSTTAIVSTQDASLHHGTLVSAQSSPSHLVSRPSPLLVAFQLVSHSYHPGCVMSPFLQRKTA